MWFMAIIMYLESLRKHSREKKYDTNQITVPSNEFFFCLCYNFELCTFQILSILSHKIISLIFLINNSISFTLIITDNIHSFIFFNCKKVFVLPFILIEMGQKQWQNSTWLNTKCVGRKLGEKEVCWAHCWF